MSPRIPTAHSAIGRWVFAFLCAVPAFASNRGRLAIPQVRCVDLLAMGRFYYYPELLRESDADALREVIRIAYPELPLWIATLRPENARAHNAAHIVRLGAESRGKIPLSRARSILRVVKEHPVARLSELPNYDPTGRIGFCFGRAYAVLLEARRLGIPELALRKFFLIGELSGKSQLWNFHSVMAIAGRNAEGWWVIDPLLEEPVLPSNWVRLFTSELARDNDELALFFAASPHQITRDPNSTIAQALQSPVVGRFFRELLQSYGINVAPQ